MAKSIYISPDEADRIVSEVRARLLNSKGYGSIEIKPVFKSDDRCAVLYFTPMAWMKMTALVAEFKTEVQWHGLVKRLSDCEFEIYDIVVPPHNVTSATVTSEAEEYAEWINGLDDELFNALRFHGHSHVDMAVSPSSVDKDYRSDVITQLPKSDENNDTFYIFLIINKRHEWSAEVYDLTHNALYSTTTKDLDMMVLLDDGDTIDNFVLEAKKVAVQRTITSQKNYNAHAASNGGYNGGTFKTKESASTSNHSKNKPESKMPSVVRDYYDRFGVDEDPTDPFYVRDELGGYR